MGSNNFSSTVDLLKGFNVNLYVGEEIIKGKLMGVETDHIILEDENKYVYYYSIDKIQAITKNTKQYKGEVITTEFMKTQSLADLLSSLKNSWVSILCLNKQSFTGVLGIVDSDFVTLINGEDRILIKISHISNILKGYRKEEKEQKSDNESESNVLEKKQEETDDKYIETQVFVKSNKQESTTPQRETVVNKVEMDAMIAPIATVNQPEIEKKGWLEPIKTSLSIAKVSNESKNIKEEKKQTSHSESVQPSLVVRQNNHSESKWTKMDVTPAPKEEIKKQNTDVVIQKIVKHDKETIQKPAASMVDKRAQIRSVAPKQELTANSTMELVNKVKKAKETFEKNSLLKIETTKRNSVENKKEDKKTTAQEVEFSRFSGEPAMRDFDRRSFFSGWPNRNSQRRI
ncbi:hypothetical protein V7124_16200 [Neobacillus niacini]|uniref:hypothetical protein n=1 Tax=Neobacillus niacini TaxID=86668 RepID=UPI003000B628